MVIRVKVTLAQKEYAALLKLAQIDMRNPEEELHFFLKEEATRRNIHFPTEDCSNFCDEGAQEICPFCKDNLGSL